MLSASDDPMLEAPVIPPQAGDNPHLSLVQTEHGGHVGFVSGRLYAPRFWGESQMLAFFDAVNAAQPK
jgi:predicted alpha/beta-fold hydrolase